MPNLANQRMPPVRKPQTFRGMIEPSAVAYSDLLRLAQENERRVYFLTQNISDGFFTLDTELRCTQWNKAAERLTGVMQADIVGKSIGEILGAALESFFRETLAGQQTHSSIFRCQTGEKNLQLAITACRSMNGISAVACDVAANENAEEARRRLPAGSVSTIMDATGPTVGASPIARNTNEGKHAEQGHDEFASRLLKAQEAERARVARELHDGIGQSLALLNIQLQRLCEPSRATRVPEIQELSAKLKQIGERVSKLSHQLHSSELEFLGLAVAIKGLCREFSQQYQIDVACTCREVPAELDQNIALCLLRITQEALHNIAKHSRAKCVRVQLVGTGEELTCTITDDGIGFDLNKARKALGLGLVSMRERMNLIGGQLTIRSGKNAGATIEAKAPLSSTAAH